LGAPEKIFLSGFFFFPRFPEKKQARGGFRGAPGGKFPLDFFLRGGIKAGGCFQGGGGGAPEKNTGFP